MKSLLFAALTAVLMSTAALAQTLTIETDAGTMEQKDASYNAPDYSPFVDRNLPGRVLWGDTHLHTSYSADAGFFGNTLDPEKAHRFARGEEVVSSTGGRVKLIRPLDFLVVADHGVYYGLPDLLVKGDPSLLADPIGKRWWSAPIEWSSMNVSA